MNKETLEELTGIKPEQPKNNKIAVAYRKTIMQIKAKIKNNQLEREKLGVEYETLNDILDILEREAE